MEDGGPSQLQGAFRNYLNSIDSGYQCISGNTGKYERCIHILKIIISFSITFAAYILILIYSKGNINFLINLAYLLVIWFCFNLLLFHKYVLWRYMFDWFRRIFYCPLSSTIPTEDRGIQTEEYTACQTAAQPDASEERIAYQPEVLPHRIEDQSALFVFRKYLSSRNFFTFGRIFCCLRSCYPTVSTEDIGIQTEDYAASQLAAEHDATDEQTGHLSERIREQAAYGPYALSATSEVSAKLQIVEQRLLHLLSSTEDEE